MQAQCVVARLPHFIQPVGPLPLTRRKRLERSDWFPRQARRSVVGIDVRTKHKGLGHESLVTTQKYLEPSKGTAKQLEAMQLPF